MSVGSLNSQYCMLLSRLNTVHRTEHDGLEVLSGHDSLHAHGCIRPDPKLHGHAALRRRSLAPSFPVLVAELSLWSIGHL